MRNRSSWCECGQPKPRRAHACERCQRLDGATPGLRNALDALRSLGTSSTLYDICDEAGVTTRHANRWVTLLERAGYLKRKLPVERPNRHAEIDRETFYASYSLVPHRERR